MNKIEESIRNLANEISPTTVFVAVSGGVDSMLLIDLSAKYFNVIALHVNYKLRGSESEGDQVFLEEFCAKSTIPIFTKEVDLHAELVKKSTNLQNRAREIRYNFFKEKLSENPNSVLFVAHHSDDQIETFFIQFYRNSGIAGLSGMKDRDGNVFRPFLHFSKKEMIECAVERNLHWREDQSNAKNVYVRNRFRNEIIPVLQEEIPTIKPSILKIMDVLKENQCLIEQEISSFIDEVRIKRIVPLSAFDFWGDERIIEFFRQLGISSGFLKEFKKILRSNKGARLDFPKSAQIKSLIREKDAMFFEFDSLYLEMKPGIKSYFVDELPEVFTKEKLYLDHSKIEGELHLRKWKLGDRIFPIGVKGSKLISDVLTDAKVLNSNRTNQWLLCDESKIISCLGYCVDRRAIANFTTEIIRCVEIEHSLDNSIKSV